MNVKNYECIIMFLLVAQNSWKDHGEKYCDLLFLPIFISFCVHISWKCKFKCTLIKCHFQWQKSDPYQPKQGNKKLDWCNLLSVVTSFFFTTWENMVGTYPSWELWNFSYKLNTVNSNFKFKFLKGKLPLQR